MPEHGGPGRRLRRTLRDTVARALFATGPTHPRRLDRCVPTVLTFHRVLPREQLAAYPLPGLAVTPERLAEVARFAARHFRVATLSEVVDAWRAGWRGDRPPLALTFDDGTRDNAVHAAPVLDAHGLRATFYLPAGFIGGARLLWHDEIAYAVAAIRDGGPDGTRAVRGIVARFELALPAPIEPTALPSAVVTAAKRLRPDDRSELCAQLEAHAGGRAIPDWDGMMSWDDARSLAEAGHEIGCHSMSHELLTGLSPDALDREVVVARDRISDQLARPVRSFCYPNGTYDADALATVRACGYESAVTTHYARNHADQDPLRLHRFNVRTDQCELRSGRFSAAVLSWRLSGRFPG